MRNNILTLVLLVICATSFAQQKMSATEVTNFKNAVNAVAKSTKTLATDFTQYKHMDFLANDIETSGKMHFKTPSMLQWQYIKPYKYSVIFKNNKIYINDGGKKSNLNSNKMFDKLSKLITGSVNGNMFDEQEFAITYYTGASNTTLLIPKDAALKKYIKQMELSFDKKTNTVSEVKMTEPSGDYTRIVFKNKMINAKIDDAVFNH